MRFFFQILITAFVIYSLFLLKDDIRGVYNRVADYVGSQTEVSFEGIKNLFLNKKTIGEDIESQSSVESSVTVINENTVREINHADTPGPLRVFDGLINGNTSLSATSVIALSNVARKQNGNLKPLIENSRLDFSAEKKMQDMFTKQYFEHVSPTGVSVSDLGKEVGYEFILIGENLALGNFKDDQALVDAWMASPGHRANILNEHYSEIGVAVGKGIFDGKTVWLAVQHFGLPKNVCPAVDNSLSVLISLNKKKLASMESDLAYRRKSISGGDLYQGQTTGEQVSAYNALVEVYNSLVLEIKRKVTEYNKGVKAFNDCVASHTSSAE